MEKLSFFADDGLKDNDELLEEIVRATASPAPSSAATIKLPPIVHEAMDLVENEAVPNPPALAPPTDKPMESSTLTLSRLAVSESTTFGCNLCNGTHPLRFCEKFLGMPIEKRHRAVVMYHYCIRCLARSHLAKDCPSRKSCRLCNDKHHTLLHDGPLSLPHRPNSRPARKHRPYQKPRVRPNNRSDTRPSADTGPSNYSNSTPLGGLPLVGVVSLSPSLVVHLAGPKSSIPVRGLIDQCARQSQICTSLVHSLRLPCFTVDSIRYCRFTVRSTHDSAQSVVVMARVCDLSHVSTPPETVPERIKKSYLGLPLADPQFFKVGRVALILGPKLYSKIMTSRVHLFAGLPMAQYSIFGWVLSGVCSN
ncbi:uncharacterized protein LOC131803251 [Musca domestica]|uniref:Uncharacterized protein LOC131803251 n=1 Tax=Musca domestica TaxID=7370 RepID=A0ABM3V3G8_MUSDO|nr:uncharacterized protein LOC131803251 [Musca domestica]